VNSDPDFDLVVIGAGIHGTALAVEAGRRDSRVLVLERFAKPGMGTSSRSSKLIHGGLRYLESLELHLVYECLAERRRLLRRYPDLVKLREFFIPVYAATRRSRLTLRTGLSLYALLGGLHRQNRFRSLPRREWADLDGLDTRGLLAVYRYFDAQTDDALLTERLAAEAAAAGSQFLFNAEFLGCEPVNEGLAVTYRRPDGDSRITARYLVNAAGPWVNEVAGRCHPASKTLDIDLVQGAHIELPGELQRGIYYLESPADRRAVFAMPWHGHVLVGTTETVYTGDPALCQPQPHEIEYLLAVYNHYFGGRKQHDIIAAWAGLRVLPRSPEQPFHRSRETILLPNRLQAPDIISLYGGKLTNHHATACKVLKMLQMKLVSG
jgi:glycerol-3-phosphate dehydrogenase